MPALAGERDGDLGIDVLNPVDDAGAAVAGGEPDADAEQGWIGESDDCVLPSWRVDADEAKRRAPKSKVVAVSDASPSTPRRSKRVPRHAVNADTLAGFLGRLGAAGMAGDDLDGEAAGCEGFGKVGEELGGCRFLRPIKTVDEDEGRSGFVRGEAKVTEVRRQ